MAAFAYPCPDCRSTSNLHDPSCRFDGARRSDIEKAYTDVLATLAAEARTEAELQRAVHGRWSARHARALDQLTREHRVHEHDDGVLELLTPEERKERVSEPTTEPMRTIYREGSVPGCHDNAVFSMVAWYEMVGLTWEETQEKTVEWLRISGAWDRGGFEEATPEEVVENKRHVYDEGYGWKEKAQAAKHVIDRTAN
ncbi:MAG: hypothetical protein U5J98_02310 [Halobacteriales archaeon]|nr:hypothetical protein [Halobacteriales archaeon]